MDKLIALCDLFHVTMDELLRGDVTMNFVDEKAEYEQEKKLFTKRICLGIFLVLMGVACMTALYAAGVREVVATAALFCFLIVAVVLFITGGLANGEYNKMHQNIPWRYEEREVRAFKKKFPLLIAWPTAAVVLDVVFVMVGVSYAMTEAGETAVTAVFLFVLALIVPIYIWAAMTYAMYDIEAYNKENDPKQKTWAESASGIIMLLAIAVYFLWSFLRYAWHISWVVFPVAAMLCGVVRLVFEMLEKKKEN